MKFDDKVMPAKCARKCEQQINQLLEQFDIFQQALHLALQFWAENKIVSETKRFLVAHHINLLYAKCTEINFDKVAH